MNVHSLAPAEITDDLWQVWTVLQQQHPALESPYFRPEFCQALRDVGRPFELAVIEENSEVVGLFPFERRPFEIGRPIGWPLNDYQGVIGQSDWKPDLCSLTRLLKLRAFDFDHLICDQAPINHPGWNRAESIVMDLSQGFETYRQEPPRNTSELFRETARKLRKAEREIGPAGFNWHVRSADVLQQLIAWKSQQYRHTGLFDVFAFEWPRRLLERLLEHERFEFGVVLSTLTLGNTLAAVHLGLRCRGTLHSWFPAYDPTLMKYSPGVALFVWLAQTAAEEGITKIDLGKGVEDYKQRFRSYGVPLAEGSITHSPMVRAVRTCWQQTRSFVETSGCRRFLETPIRLVRKSRRSLELS